MAPPEEASPDGVELETKPFPALQAGDAMGCSVAIAGQWGVVGACGDSQHSGVSGGGAAYFVNVNTIRVHLFVVASDPIARGRFGSAVAVTNDGSTILVGAEGATGADGFTLSGAAYVFTLVNLEVVSSRKLTATDGLPQDHVGCSVAIHNGRALVGARGPDSAIGARSATHMNGGVYVFNIATGQQLTKLMPSTEHRTTGTCLWFGASLAVTERVILVGAPHARSPCAGSGRSVRSGTAFTFDASTLSLTNHLQPSDGRTGDRFGTAVAAYDLPDGTSQLLIGSPDHGSANGFSKIGVVYRVEQRITNGVATVTWPPRLLGATTGLKGGTGTQFGTSIAVDGPSGLALIGAVRNSGQNGLNAGSMELVRFPTGDEPTLKNVVINRTLWATDGNPGESFGKNIAINSAGVALVGTSQHQHNYVLTGGAYIYRPLFDYPPPAPPPLYSPSRPPLAPGTALVAKLVYTVIARGTVTSFNTAFYKDKLATVLSVEVSQIEVELTPASVRVVSTITSTNVTTVQAMAEFLGALNATEATAAFGVVIESVEPPRVIMEVVAAPPPPLDGAVQQDLAAIVGVVALSLSVVIAVLLFWVVCYPKWHRYTQQREAQAARVRNLKARKQAEAELMATHRRIAAPKRLQTTEEVLKEEAVTVWNELALGHGKVNIALLEPLLVRFFEKNPKMIHVQPNPYKMRDPLPIRAAAETVNSLLREGTRHWNREDYAKWAVDFSLRWAKAEISERNTKCASSLITHSPVRMLEATSSTKDVLELLAPVEKVSAGIQASPALLRPAWASSTDLEAARPQTPQFAQKLKAQSDSSWEAYKMKREASKKKQRASLKVASFAVRARQLQLQHTVPARSAPSILPNSPGTVLEGNQQQLEERLPMSLIPPLSREDSGRISRIGSASRSRIGSAARSRAGSATRVRIGSASLNRTEASERTIVNEL